MFSFRYNESMSPQNYTPIDELVKKHQTSKPQWPQSFSKESEPSLGSGEMLSMDETGEHEVNDEEVKKFVEINKDQVEIDPELKKAGVEVVEHPKYPPHLSLPLPVSDERVMEGLHAPINTGLRWIAEFSVYWLRQAHIGLKKVHGKVIRVIRN